MKNDADRSSPKLTNREKCKRYKQQFLEEYRADVMRLTHLLEEAKMLLAIAEKQAEAGEPVVSKFARRWKLY